MLTCSSREESKRLNQAEGARVIISASGMMTGGRVLHHLRNRLPRSNDTICFVGFQTPGTIGQQLLAGQKRPRIMGVPIDVKANIQPDKDDAAIKLKKTYWEANQQWPRRVKV